jgi:hypothetical protein
MKNGSTAIACILMGAALTFSQNHPGPGGLPDMPPLDGPSAMHSWMENPPLMMMNITELQSLMAEINIDKGVSAKIVAITRAFVKFLDERILKIQKEELNIREELLKDKPDMPAIQNAIARKTQILGEVEFAQIKRDLDIKSLLTVDEYDRWKSAIMVKLRERMPRGADRNGPGGPAIRPGGQK